MRAPSVGEREREIKHTDSVCLTGRGWLLLCWAGSVAAGLVLPGSAQLGCPPFFFVLNPFLFLFSITFTTFAFVTQMTSNQKQMFSKIQGIKVGQ
jgi:hypothetical protein